ncbi:MAG: TonB-dependent receptor, partial [Bacteroidetes bacterium]
MTLTSKTVAQATIAFLLLVLSFTLATAQTTLIGTVVDSRTDEPLPGVEVRLLAERTVTDAFGGFELKVVLSAGQSSLLVIAQDGFEPVEQEVTGTGGTRIDLGVIGLRPSGQIDQSVTDELIPTIVLNSDDLDGGSGGVQNISGVLTASRDAFISAAAFVFGPARFNIRGYDAQYTTVLMNGLPMGDMETGRIFWNNWGGLNDVMRLRTNTIGLGASTFAFGGIGGASIIDTRAGSQRKQLRLSYALSNRTYRNRLMFNYNTGRLPSGWAVSLSGSRRWADEGYVEGTFYDAWSYFLSVDRELGRKAVLNLTAFGAPVRRGKISGATQEIYDLAGTNFYNANWGFQNGKKRNARVQDVHQPVAMLRLDWDLNDKLKWMTTAGVKTGRTGNTALDWYNGADPRPQYYRYLPSWFADSEQAERIAALWATDPTVSQIDWNRLYQTNYNSFETIENANGIEGNTVSGLRSQYIIEDRRSDVTMGAFNTVIEAFLTDRITVQGGLTYSQQKTENFKTIDDLLGGDFYLNVDRFAEFDSSGIFVENNLEVPNQILREGDRWGYDYDYHIRQGTAWAQFNLNLPKVDAFASVSGGQTIFWRHGNVANGKFPENSAGESARSNFSEYAVKGGLTYKIDGRNYLLVNAAVQSRAPYVRDAFRSPRTRNQLVDGLTQAE